MTSKEIPVNGGDDASTTASLEARLEAALAPPQAMMDKDEIDIDDDDSSTATDDDDVDNLQATKPTNGKAASAIAAKNPFDAPNPNPKPAVPPPIPKTSFGAFLEAANELRKVTEQYDEILPKDTVKEVEAAFAAVSPGVGDDDDDEDSGDNSEEEDDSGDGNNEGVKILMKNGNNTNNNGDGDSSTGSPTPSIIDDLARRLSDGGDPFFDAAEEEEDFLSEQEEGSANKPAYTAQTVAAISSLMKGEESALFAPEDSNNGGGGQHLPSSSEGGSFSKKREITLQDRAHAMISVYKDYLHEEEVEEADRRDEEAAAAAAAAKNNGSQGRQGDNNIANPTNNFMATNNPLQKHALSNAQYYRKEKIKVATLEKFCKEIPNNNDSSDSGSSDSSQSSKSTESVEDNNAVIIDDDYYERPETIQPTQLRAHPKPRLSNPTAASTTAAFRLKAEVALKAVGSTSKKVAQKTMGAVTTKVRNRMNRSRDIQEAAEEFGNDYDFCDYKHKVSGELTEEYENEMYLEGGEVQDEVQDDLEYGTTTGGADKLKHKLQNDGDAFTDDGTSSSQADSMVYGLHILDRDKSLKRNSNGNNPDEDIEAVGLFNELCDDLGVTPHTHPGLRDGLHHFYHHPRTTRYRYPIFRTRKFKQAMMYLGILLLVLLISVSIISAVSNGFEEVKKKKQPPLPDWKEEEEWRNKQKEEWEKDHHTNGNSDNGGKLELGVMSGNNGGTSAHHNPHQQPTGSSTIGLSSQDHVSKLFQQVSAAYRPIWYDRSTGWTGTTYPEALSWCASHDNYIPCPYEVYCPYEKKLLAGNVMEEDGESWSAVINADNEWVQVGTGGNVCELYSSRYGKKPVWGESISDGNGDDGAVVVGSEEITRHIMCCRSHPMVGEEDGSGSGGGEDWENEAVMRPDGGGGAPPDVDQFPIATEGEDQFPIATEGEEGELPLASEEQQQHPIEAATEEEQHAKQVDLDILFTSVSKTYHPVWFDRAAGWKGQSYQDSLDFCAGEIEGYIPCPYDAYCPGGRGKLIDGIQDDGESWSAVIDQANDWVQVGAGGECNLYSETEMELPEWGMTGENNEEITRHIMCCHSAPHLANVISGDASATSGVDTTVVSGDTSSSGIDTTWAEDLKYHPMHFSSDDSEWKGTTYDDAIAFCESVDHGSDGVNGDKYHICPLAAFCPNGPKGPKPLFLEMGPFDGVQWAPISDEYNGWIMVGKFTDQQPETCLTHKQIIHQEPDWGLDGTSPELKKHIMCCKDDSDDGYGGAQEGVAQGIPDSNNEDVMGPPLVTLPLPDNVISTPPLMNLPEPHHAMTPLEMDVLNNHHPVWFNSDNSPWKGTTYDDAKSFCESMSHGFDPVSGSDGKYHICPLSAFCPNGPTQNEPLFLQMEAFHEIQWAPISNVHNGWVMVGKYNDEQPLTCQTHMQINHHDPDWGLDGTLPGMKKHIMCCEDNTDPASDDAADQPEGAMSQLGNNVPNSAQNFADSIATSDEGISNQESGSMTAMETQIQDRHHPSWFSKDFGWQGTTYEDAKSFCESIPHGEGGTLHLCPLEAYCPNGPRDTEPLYQQMDAFGGAQWAPISNGDNEWVMVGDAEFGGVTCKTFFQINNRDPIWGLDGSSAQLKEHLLCCEDNSANYDGSGNDKVESSINPLSDLSVGMQNGVESADISAGEAQDEVMPVNDSQEVGVSSKEDSIMKTFTPVWFDADVGGWSGGSHDEAIEFCEQFAGSHGKTMELCPYTAVCPNGPSNPPIGGHEANFDEEGEQWAPVYGKSNHWVLISKRGTNIATTCLSHVQVTGEEASWGLDGSRPELKKHVICCSPLQ